METNNQFIENDEEIKSLFGKKHKLHRTYHSKPTSSSKKDAFSNNGRSPKKSSTICQICGSIRRQMKYRRMLIRKTLNISMLFQNLYMCHLLVVYACWVHMDWKLSTEKEIFERRDLYFNTVINRPSIINDEAIDRMSPLQKKLALAEPSACQKFKSHCHKYHVVKLQEQMLDKQKSSKK